MIVNLTEDQYTELMAIVGDHVYAEMTDSHRAFVKRLHKTLVKAKNV